MTAFPQSNNDSILGSAPAWASTQVVARLIADARLQAAKIAKRQNVMSENISPSAASGASLSPSSKSSCEMDDGIVDELVQDVFSGAHRTNQVTLLLFQSINGSLGKGGVSGSLTNLLIQRLRSRHSHHLTEEQLVSTEALSEGHRILIEGITDYGLVSSLLTKYGQQACKLVIIIEPTIRPPTMTKSTDSSNTLRLIKPRYEMLDGENLVIISSANN